MLFPSDSVEQARLALAEKLADSSLDPAAALNELLELDPADRVALFELARLSQQAGDLAQAEAIARKGLAAHPCDYRFYVLLSGLLAEQNRDIPLASGFLELGVLKLLGNPGVMEDAERLRRLGKFPGTTVGFEDPEELQTLAESLKEQREHEPPAVTEALLPLRLIHELEETLGNEMEQEQVDAILKEGAACRPLLVGVLRGLAQDYLPDGGELMAEAALALLGEIGDPASLPVLVQFAIVEDKAISDISAWSLLRVAGLNPEATLAACRNFDRTMNGPERACLAETVAAMVEAPGKAEVITSLWEGMEAVDEATRSDAFIVIAAALLAVDGKEAPPVIRAAAGKLHGVLPVEAAGAIDDLLKAYALDPSAFTIPPEEGVPTVYDICCADRIQDEEDAEEEEEEEHIHGPGCSHGHHHHADDDDFVEQVVSPGLPGRNEPCWCGSGKKYKKCHLAADEAASRN